MPPRALSPSGILLVDKPAGPTSFDIVAATRRRTGARTGHAGTLDPFASGLLLLLSGAATRLQGRFVGLDKRYLTEIDLSARTSTGDPEGEVVEEHEPPGRSELEERLAGLRGRGRAADPGRVGGEDRRRARVQAPSARCRGRDAGAADDGARAAARELRGRCRALDLLVSSGTYVRAIAEALGGHCAHAAPDRDRAVLDRRGRRGADHPARGRAREARVNVARSPEELERRPRAVAIGSFDGVHRGHRAVLAAAQETGLAPTVITFDPHPRIALGNKVDLLTTLERRLELLGEAGVETTLVAAFTPELQQLEPEEFAERYLRAIGAEAVVAGEDFRFGVRRSGDLALLERLGFRSSSRTRSRASPRPRSAPRSAEGDVVRRRRDARAAVRARRHRGRG